MSKLFKILNESYIFGLSEGVEISDDFQIISVDPNHDRDTYGNVISIFKELDPISLKRFGGFSPLSEITANYRLLAFHRGNPIGMIEGFFYNYEKRYFADNHQPNINKRTKYSWIEALMLKEYQGHGIMPKLVNIALKEMLEKYNIYNFLWAVDFDNHYSKKIPKSMGFILARIIDKTEYWVKCY